MQNMPMNQMQQRFSRVEQCIDDAEMACRSAGTVSPELKECIGEMSRRSHEAHDLMAQSPDENRIVECVDSLEKLGDRAMQACRRAGAVDPALRDAVQAAHDELSQLKHQLH